MQDMKLCTSPPPPPSLRTQSNRNGLGVLKNYVATENKDMTLKSVEELFRKRHAELKDQPEFWKKCVEKVKRIDPSQKAAINGSKRGQEGITNEAIFLCWKFPIVKPNFVIFFNEIR